jgi:hypothetical protein
VVDVYANKGLSRNSLSKLKTAATPYWFLVTLKSFLCALRTLR